MLEKENKSRQMKNIQTHLRIYLRGKKMRKSKMQRRAKIYKQNRKLKNIGGRQKLKVFCISVKHNRKNIAQDLIDENLLK